MFDTLVNDVKNVLVNPSEAFRRLKEIPLSGVYKFYVTLLIIFSILFMIVSVAMGIASMTSIISMFGKVPILGGLISSSLAQFTSFVIAWEIFSVYLAFLVLMISVFIGGLILHAFVLLFIGDKDPVATIKANMYAATPFFILGWIPYLNIIGALWSLVLLIIGLKEAHDVPLGKAFLVVVVPLVLLFILIGLGAAVIVTFFDALFGIFRSMM